MAGEVENIGKPFTHAGGVILGPHITGGHSIVLGKQARNRRWSFPKGHIENGETPAQAANREVYEETGLRIAQLGFIGCISHQSRRTGLTRIQAMYAYMYEGPLKKPETPEEILEVRRFSIQEASSLLQKEDGEFLTASATQQQLATIAIEAARKLIWYNKN